MQNDTLLLNQVAMHMNFIHANPAIPSLSELPQPLKMFKIFHTNLCPFNALVTEASEANDTDSEYGDDCQVMFRHYHLPLPLPH